MPEVLSLVNTISSTSIPVEIANAVNEHTASEVTVGVVMETGDVALDPDVKAMDLPTDYFGATGNFDLPAYYRLWNYLGARDYDLIHTHHNFSGAVARTIGKFLDIPVVNTEHNDLRFLSLPQRIVNGATFGLPRVNVYNSHSTQSSLGPVERWLSNEDEVIYNGIDIDRVVESQEYSLPVEVPSGTIVTNVGVMTDQKNQAMILEAASEFAEFSEAEDVHFVIAGSGPLEDELKTYATRLGVDDIVTFTGYLPRREHIYSLLHRSDVFLVPSVYEGFCVAAVEAMACELPVIASDIEVLREVIGESGIFARSDDPERLADRILHTVSSLDTQAMQHRRAALHQRAVTKFSLERTANAYHDLYLEYCR